MMRHRLRTKIKILGAAQVAHGAAVAPHPGLLAIADEGWPELRMLMFAKHMAYHASYKSTHWLQLFSSGRSTP